MWHSNGMLCITQFKNILKQVTKQINNLNVNYKFCYKINALTEVKIFRHIYDQLKYLGLFKINIMYIELLWRNEHMRKIKIITAKTKQCI